MREVITAYWNEGNNSFIEQREEIARCRDCKYMERLPWLDDEDFKAMVCRKHTFTGMRKEDFFCADGERKTNDA